MGKHKKNEERKRNESFFCHIKNEKKKKKKKKKVVKWPYQGQNLFTFPLLETKMRPKAQVGQGMFLQSKN